MVDMNLLILVCAGFMWPSMLPGRWGCIYLGVTLEQVFHLHCCWEPAWQALEVDVHKRRAACGTRRPALLSSSLCPTQGWKIPSGSY